MKCALAVLLISSLTSTGLLSLWAATSPRPWFLRTALFAGVLSLLLLIPAYELVVAFALQGATVALGIQIARRFQRTGPVPPRRFSLATLLQVTTVVAVLFAVGVKLPALNFLAWQSVALIGGSAGCVTLLSYWGIRGQSLRWWIRILLAVLPAFGLTLLLAGFGYFVVSLLGFNTWPPADLGITGGFLASLAGREYSFEAAAFFWGLDFAAIFALLGLSIWLVYSGLLSSKSLEPQSQGLRWKSCLLLLIIVVTLAPSAYVYCRLMTPLPIFAQDLPIDNGFDDLIEGGQLALSSPFDNVSFDANTVGLAVLRTAVADAKPAYLKLKAGLSKKVQVPVSFQGLDSCLFSIQEIRSLARCMQGQAILARREKRYSDAAKNNLKIIKLGYESRKKGLIIDALVGIAVNGLGQQELYHLRAELAPEQTAQVINVLERLEAECEPAAAFMDRERIWGQHAFGWHGHLMQLLTDIDRSYLVYEPTAFQSACHREQAISRLLRIELALFAFRNEQGQLPASLDRLVPEYLSAVPLDPFDPAHQQLLYRREGKEYVLYSVGPDGEDDGGVLPEDYQDSEQSYWFIEAGGDLRLKHYFAPPVEIVFVDEEE